MSEQMPQFSEVQQLTYNNGVNHVYGVNAETGNKEHISHDSVLEAHGYTAAEAQQNVDAPVDLGNPNTVESEDSHQEQPEDISPWARREAAAAELADAQKAVGVEEAKTQLASNRWESRMATHMAGKEVLNKLADNPDHDLSDEEISKMNRMEDEAAQGEKHGFDPITEDDEKYYLAAKADETAETPKEATETPNAETPVEPVPEGETEVPKGKYEDVESSELHKRLMDAVNSANDHRINSRTAARDLELSDIDAIFDEFIRRGDIAPNDVDEARAILAKELGLTSPEDDQKQSKEAQDTIDQLPYAEDETSVKDRIGRRWGQIKQSVKNGKNAVLVGVGGIFGGTRVGRNSEQLDSNEAARNKSRKWMIGAAAVAGGVGIFLIGKKAGLDIDPGFFDSDGIDLNPFNNVGESTPDVSTPDTGGGEGTPVGPEGSPTSPETLTSVNVDAGEGTSHIARDTLGINFDTADQWNEFNSQTNSLFADLDGVYQDAATGEYRIQNPGNFQVPQNILEEMQRAAEEIKNS